MKQDNDLAHIALRGQLAALHGVREQQLQELTTTDDNIAAISRKVECLRRSGVPFPRIRVVETTNKVLYPLAILYQMSVGNWAIAAFTVTSFAVSFKMYTLNRQLNHLRVLAFIVAPSSAALGLLGVTPKPSLIPAAVLLPGLGALLHRSVWQQLTLTLFLNALVFCCAEMNLARAVSALTTPVTMVAVMAMMDNNCSPASHRYWRYWRDWCRDNTMGSVVAVPFGMLMLLLRLHVAYPNVIWQLVREFEDSTTMSHVLGILCLISSYTCSSMPLENIHAEHLQNTFFLRWTFGGLHLFLYALCGLHMISTDNWLGIGVLLVLSALHVRVPPSQQTATTCLYIIAFGVGPFMTALGKLGVVTLQSGIPMAVLIPSFGALLHRSVWQQLTLALFLNALVFCCTETNLARAVSALATPLTCIAVYIKMTKLTAVSQAFEAVTSKQLVHREETKRHQAELAAATETAKADLYCQIVSATAHDMRTPMSAIKSGCSAIRMQMSEEQLSECLSCMEETLIVAFDFIDTMVLTAKYMSSKGDRMPVGKQETVFLKQMASRMISCTSHGVSPATTIHFEISDSVPASVIIDQSFVTRSVLNFLSNAARHTKEGTICLSIDLSPCSSFLIFSISDSGRGVSSSDLNRIWDPFVSFSNSSGLGLFIVKAQCTTAGGECGHRAGPDGTGAVFWFSSPFLPSLTKQTLEPARPQVGHAKGIGETKRNSFEVDCAEQQSGALVEMGQIVSLRRYQRNTEVRHQPIMVEALTATKPGRASIVAPEGAETEMNPAADSLNAYERSVFDTGHLDTMNKLLAHTQEEMLGMVGSKRKQLKKKQQLMDQMIGARHATSNSPSMSPRYH